MKNKKGTRRKVEQDEREKKGEDQEERNKSKGRT